MDRNARNKIFRELLSSIIGSGLSSKELRQLAELLSSGEFSYELGRAVFEISHTLEPQDSFAWPEEVELSTSPADDGLVGLAYKVVQRRRLPKRELIRMMADSAPRVISQIENGELSSRRLLETFFEVASTRQIQKFLRELGMDVAHDPYLGGITSRGNV